MSAEAHDDTEITRDQSGVDDLSTEPSVEWLSAIFEANDKMIEEVIEKVGAATVAGFFIATGWGIAVAYDVPIDIMEEVNQSGYQKA